MPPDGEPFAPELFPRARTELAPGAVHLPEWLSPGAQLRLVEACREWAKPPAGLRLVRTPGGGTMTARQFCLGWHWYPYGYARTVVDGDGAPVKAMPPWLAALGAAAAEAAGHAVEDTYDIALVNFYDADARMGMHRDSDEKSSAPVVSLSLGDTCVFRFGNTRTRTKPYTDVELRSGDLLVFGGPSRLAYHGVPRVLPGTAPPELGLTGRLNVTLRVSGLTEEGGPPDGAPADGAPSRAPLG
ncbi:MULTISPECIES: alpha-ketoglutarate-dependent dioxygenase AlkB family protein [Streptomyces]|uniref:alpha-ketoglutarate-dependent dioxygenase AlkB family protein n=1 Tax=Streptomyces TaxID=1883 RepID=UPI001E50AB7B|nr:MULTISPECIES: alpha-ketoglutarate-dependent dioxygenase AlkB [Streptomyces]UFQ14226.1 alpha-ketoglutarate-dependent dioxygenase AlkB [Streptomyces huasconensis]WCL83825.1 alpha-ketoglutarate-dependent dioxygenase AlkB [Streptomyces sp. JCM 35825]